MKMKWRETIRIHPATELFPLMSPDALADLAENVREVRGIKVKIRMRTVEGVEYLIDGRNRLDACETAAIKVPDEMFDRKESTHAEIAKEIVALNLKRRDYTTGERCKIADKLATFSVGGSGSNQYVKAKPSTEGIATVDAAKIAGIGDSTLSKYRKIKRESPTAAKAIDEGKITVNAAYDNLKKRRSREDARRVTIKTNENEILLPQAVETYDYRGPNECKMERLMPKRLEGVFNDIANFPHRFIDFLFLVEEKIGYAVLRRITDKIIAKEGQRKRLREQMLSTGRTV